MTADLLDPVAQRVLNPPKRLQAAAYTEEAVSFDCGGERLLGVLSLPAVETIATGTAVLIVVGGPQYRVGAHRQFVQLARTLAGAGHVAMRFDYRGMGDGSGAQRSFEDVSDDIAAAAHALRARQRSLQRLVLFGLCDGASAALLCLPHAAASRIDGLCLLNPWVRSEATLARTHLKHYYRHRLTDPSFWRKLLGGGVGTRQLRGFFRSLRSTRSAGIGRTDGAAPTFQQAMAAAWRAFVGPVLLLSSEDDLTAREFTEHASNDSRWRGLLGRQGVTRITLAGADHTLSTREAQRACEAAFLTWLGTTGSSKGSPP